MMADRCSSLLASPYISRKCTAAALIFFELMPVLACAEDTPTKPENPSWIISIGGMATFGPQYIGAKEYGLSGYPSISFRRTDEAKGFSSPDDSLDYALYETKQFSIGPVLNIRAGRSTRNDGRLAGLNNYPWVVESGIFMEYWPIQDSLRTRAELRHGLKRGDGFTADISVDAVKAFGSFTFSGGPRVSIVDNHIMDEQFGVSVPASVQNGMLAPFKARGGIRSVGLGATLDYDWSPQWRTTVYQRYDRLLGDATDSSLTRQLESKDQFTFGLGLTYSFKFDGFDGH